MNRLYRAILNHLKAKEQDELLTRYGGIQWCPWCKQVAQSQPGWHFEAWPRDRMLDVLTCGVCKGTSLWKFEIGMMWIGALEPPPVPAPAHYYDIEQAELHKVTPGQSPYRVMPVPATLRQARKAWEQAYPILQAIGDWEREHGTAACLMSYEVPPFLQRLTKGLIHGSARGAIAYAAQPRPKRLPK